MNLLMPAAVVAVAYLGWRGWERYLEARERQARGDAIGGAAAAAQSLGLAIIGAIQSGGKKKNG